jgi:uncharacterized protein (DUF433 family)
MEPIKSDPEILGGTPCFSGTRVPVKTLFDHLQGGYTISYFLEDFPTVTRAQAEAVLQLALRSLAPSPSNIPQSRRAAG